MPSSARPTPRTSGTSPDIDPRTLRRPGARRTIDLRMDQSTLARPVALLEREHELERVRAALRAAGQRAGAALVIEGAAGMGKSRLLEEARARASDLGLRVLAARATELEQGFPFGVVRQLFERPLLEADTGERERWLAGAAALAADVLTGAPTASVAGARPSRRRSRLRMAARPVLARLQPRRRFAARARGRRSAVVRRAVGARARVHRAPARGAAARAHPRHPAARSRADARGGGARCRSRRGTAAPIGPDGGGRSAHWSPPGCPTSPTIGSSARAST